MFKLLEIYSFTIGIFIYKPEFNYALKAQFGMLDRIRSDRIRLDRIKYDKIRSDKILILYNIVFGYT